MAHKRRAKGEGSVIYNANGTVSIRISVGTRLNGGKKTKTFTGKTLAEATRKRDAFKKKENYLDLKVLTQ